MVIEGVHLPLPEVVTTTVLTEAALGLLQEVQRIEAAGILQEAVVVPEAQEAIEVQVAALGVREAIEAPEAVPEVLGAPPEVREAHLDLLAEGSRSSSRG